MTSYNCIINKDTFFFGLYLIYIFPSFHRHKKSCPNNTLNIVQNIISLTRAGTSSPSSAPPYARQCKIACGGAVCDDMRYIYFTQIDFLCSYSRYLRLHYPWPPLSFIILYLILFYIIDVSNDQSKK